jgi:hypothetical protein
VTTGRKAHVSVENQGDLVPDVEKHSATSMGWVRRLDIGGDVWELPNGKLHKHYDNSEPVLAVLRGVSK